MRDHCGRFFSISGGSTQERSTEAVIGELLARRDVGDAPLPTLRPEPSALEEYYERFSQWLKDLIGPVETGGVEPSNFAPLLTSLRYLVYAAVAVAVVLALMAFVRWLSRRLDERAGRGQSIGQEGPHSRERREMEGALRQGQVALALRLRWRIFLRTAEAPLHTTPLEARTWFDSSEARELLTACTQAMFGTSSAGAKLFRSVDSLLAECEAVRRERRV